MAPFDRLLQRVNAIGCVGFVAILLIQILGWVSGSRLPHEAFSLGSNWTSLTVRAASRDSDEAVRSPMTYGGLVATQRPTRTAGNRLTLTPADSGTAEWSSDEDARLVAARLRYEASFREFRRRMSSSTVEPGKALPSEAIVPFSPAAQPQYAEASTCGAQMSEVAELRQHR
jgi:hypothetical protein